VSKKDDDQVICRGFRYNLYLVDFTSLDEEVDGQERITFGDNSKGKVQGLGKVAISNDHSVSNVLYVASLSFNLLSVSQLCDLGF
jgi:hypothetical protein